MRLHKYFRKLCLFGQHSFFRISIERLFSSVFEKMSSVAYSSFWNGYPCTQASRIIFCEFWGFQISVKGSFFGRWGYACSNRPFGMKRSSAHPLLCFSRIDAVSGGMHLKNKMECSKKNILSKSDSVSLVCLLSALKKLFHISFLFAFYSTCESRSWNLVMEVFSGAS